MGHFAVMHDRPLEDGERALFVMRIFAARARAEAERLHAEEAWRASEERLARVVATAADGIVVTDEEGRIVLFNPGAERILRCRAADVVGQKLDRFATDEGRAASQAVLRQLAAEPDALVFYGEDAGVFARRADGSLFLQEGSLSRSEQEGRLLYTVIFRDCEERRTAGRELDEVRRQNQYLREELQAVHNFEEIVGRSPALQASFDEVSLVAQTDTTVLLLGETGTGKELFARAIHAGSRRRDQPLVKVNCAALAPGLVESELFGHEKGAFTGATERRIGRFELADRGTLFLDEMGDIPLDTQVKLLRVLQEREFERAGGTRTLAVDVRVIAATNRDLERAVAEGRFREDLFYRLTVFPLRLPPLRERPEDIPLLAGFFLTRHATRLGRAIDRISDETLARLVAYRWPGNVRELENVIERAVIVSRGTVLEVSPGLLLEPPLARPASSIRVPDAPHAASNVPDAPADCGAARLDAVERGHILATLRATAWRIEGPSGAADRLGLNPSTLRSRIKKLGISRSRDAAP